MKRRPQPTRTYSLLAVLAASPTEPTPVASRTHQLTRMYAGLRAIEQTQEPTTDDWRVCCDAVNLTETLVAQGLVADASGLLTDAVMALAMAGKRPVVEIMFADFVTLCMDQIYNHAVKFPGMFPDSDVPQ